MRQLDSAAGQEFKYGNQKILEAEEEETEEETLEDVRE